MRAHANNACTLRLTCLCFGRRRGGDLQGWTHRCPQRGAGVVWGACEVQQLCGSLVSQAAPLLLARWDARRPLLWARDCVLKHSAAMQATWVHGPWPTWSEARQARLAAHVSPRFITPHFLIARRKVEEAQLAAARAAEAAAASGSGAAAPGGAVRRLQADLGAQQQGFDQPLYQQQRQAHAPSRRPAAGLIVVEEGALG